MGLAETLKFISASGDRAYSIEANMKNFSDTVQDNIKSQVSENIAAVHQMHQMIIILNSIIFLLTIGIAIYLSRRISRPLITISAVVENIVAGDLRTKALLYNGDDEIEDLMKSAFSRTRFCCRSRRSPKTSRAVTDSRARDCCHC